MSEVEYRLGKVGDADAIRALLASEGLPVEDLGGSRQEFVVVLAEERLVGCVAVEVVGEDCLLRSLAVVADRRGEAAPAALRRSAIVGQFGNPSGALGVLAGLAKSRRALRLAARSRCGLEDGKPRQLRAGGAFVFRVAGARSGRKRTSSPSRQRFLRDRPCGPRSVPISAPIDARSALATDTCP